MNEGIHGRMYYSIMVFEGKINLYKFRNSEQITAGGKLALAVFNGLNAFIYMLAVE